MPRKIHRAVVMIMIEIAFENVTPKPTPKSFKDLFIEAMDRSPKIVNLTFRQEESVLYVQTSFTYREKTLNNRISAPATKELIFAILCAFRYDMSKIAEYSSEGKDWISTEDETEDLRVEIFKTFLASPYQKIGVKCWKPDTDNPDSKYFCIKFPVNSCRFVSFCLPNYKEMYALYKEARDNNIGNNK